MQGTTTVDFSELGKSLASVKVSIDYTLTPYVPATYNDPGDPVEAGVDAVQVLEYISGDCEYTRAERPDWFALLDAVMIEKLHNENVIHLIR
jgi:hypothetical protein